MSLLHQHLIVRARIAAPPSDPSRVKQWMGELVDKLGMKLAPLPNNPQAYYCDMIGNRGLTAVGIIETSHLALHVWDEDEIGLAQLDVYTCSCLDVDMVLKHFDVYQPVSLEYKFLDRENELVELQSGQRSAPALA